MTASRREFMRQLFAAGLACPVILRPKKTFSLPAEPVVLVPPSGPAGRTFLRVYEENLKRIGTMLDSFEKLQPVKRREDQEPCFQVELRIGPPRNQELDWWDRDEWLHLDPYNDTPWRRR